MTWSLKATLPRFLKFIRAAMGFVSTGDEYIRRCDEAFRGLTNTTKYADDVCVWDEDLMEHIRHVRAFLERCRQHQVTLNLPKFVFAKSSVQYAGFVLKEGGVAADPNKVAAIERFPTPNNITQLRSFMGMVEQLAGFSPDVSAAATPLRPLLRP